jgi:rSAM/selenodomain-associated transferase 1
MATPSPPHKLCAIAVMAKAPQPGRAKTRLVPPLTGDEAATIGAAFLRDITDNLLRAAQAAPIHCYAAYAPAGSEALLAGHLAPGTRLVLADGSLEVPGRVQGFGRSLLHAATSLFARGYGAAVLLNSDSPTLPNSLLRQATVALTASGDRVVLGPAEDGGYYLIGMKAPHVHLFEDVAWSTEAVAEQTRARARALGLELLELAPWYDVDDCAALRRLVREVTAPRHENPVSAYAAPFTAAVVAELRLADRLAAPVGACG